MIKLSNNAYFVNFDGKKGKLYDYISYPTQVEQKFASPAIVPISFIEHLNLVFTSDGKHFAYIGRRNGKKFIIFDDKEYGGYDYIDSSIISSDGKHLAYVAEKTGATPSEYKYFSIIDGKKWRIQHNLIAKV